MALCPLLILLQQAQHLALAALHHADKLLVGGAARLPAFHHVIPRAGAVLEEPAFSLRVEMRREGAVDDVFLLLLIVVRGNLELQFLTERHGCGHPDLPQFVVAVALEAVVKLLAVLLQAVRQAKPLYGQHEHPVDRFLQLLVAAVIDVEPAHPLLAVSQVESLFLVYLDEGALPGAKGGTLEDIAEQGITGAVIEGVGTMSSTQLS